MKIFEIFRKIKVGVKEMGEKIENESSALRDEKFPQKNSSEIKRSSSSFNFRGNEAGNLARLIARSNFGERKSFSKLQSEGVLHFCLVFILWLFLLGVLFPFWVDFVNLISLSYDILFKFLNSESVFKLILETFYIKAVAFIFIAVLFFYFFFLSFPFVDFDKKLEYANKIFHYIFLFTLIFFCYGVIASNFFSDTFERNPYLDEKVEEAKREFSILKFRENCVWKIFNGDNDYKNCINDRRFKTENVEVSSAKFSIVMEKITGLENSFGNEEILLREKDFKLPLNYVLDSSAPVEINSIKVYVENGEPILKKLNGFSNKEEEGIFKQKDLRFGGIFDGSDLLGNLELQQGSNEVEIVSEINYNLESVFSIPLYFVNCHNYDEYKETQEISGGYELAFKCKNAIGDVFKEKEIDLDIYSEKAPFILKNSFFLQQIVYFDKTIDVGSDVLKNLNFKLVKRKNSQLGDFNNIIDESFEKTGTSIKKIKYEIIPISYGEEGFFVEIEPTVQRLETELNVVRATVDLKLKINMTKVIRKKVNFVYLNQNLQKSS